MAVVLDAPTDDDLLARLRAGDDVAFQALVDRHRPWLVRLCTRLLGRDVHAAEDAAQESLLKLHAAARQGRPLRVRPWLMVVARNTCVDEQRRRRPDLPGELPEPAVWGDDSELDSALGDAWSRLCGRHREVLYLREVLGFSYKEIGALMGLSMAATETLVFRARAALRREYERSGGSSFGCLVLGLQLARLGDRQREAGVAGRLSTMPMPDAGLGGLSRLTHFLSTSLPGCGEQAMAKVLSVAAGVVMAAASMTAGFGPFADASPAGAAAAPALSATAGPAGLDEGSAPAALTKPRSLKALLGNAIPGDWAPRRLSVATTAADTAGSTGGESGAGQTRPTPLREAFEAIRSQDRPQWHRPERPEANPSPLRSILTARPDGVERPERPRPIGTLRDDPSPLALDGLPLDDLPSDDGPPDDGPLEVLPLDLQRPAEPLPAEPAAPEAADEREARPRVKETVPPVIATFAGDERTPLRFRNR